MEIKLASGLKIETSIPIQQVICFHFSWRPDEHTILKLQGYIDRNIKWNPEQSYNSRIKIWLEEDEKIQIIYYGYVVITEIDNIGQTSQVVLKAKSASCQLDRRIESCSFQNTDKTYGEVVREMVQAEGGQVIRNQESDKKIKTPVLRCDETVWQFAKRMAGRLGIYVIPDIETGNPNIWFGMRTGREVQVLPEEQCVIQVCRFGTRIHAEGRSFYKIGDTMRYQGQGVTIIEVVGRYLEGELTFQYIMQDKTVPFRDNRYEFLSAGQGFWGIIKEIKEESIKIALDIDNGRETGEYFYPWYPETGNVLYSMPEVGSKALLFFLEAGHQNGAIIHCLNKKQENERNYENRGLDIQDGNYVQLSKETISFSHGSNHTLCLCDDAISTDTSNGLKIIADGKVRLNASRITINTPEKLNLCQGGN